MLALEGVSVDLAGVPVLRAVTARIDAGTTTAIVGRNGAGKTTLLRTTMGFVKPTRGRIVFDGAELHRLPPHARAALGIGYAPEERVIFPTLTVQENLRLPCEALRLDERAIAARFEGVLAVVPQLQALLPRLGAALSGGQGKMVALGRALMAGTRLLLLDEPLQGLAPALALQYAEALARLRRERPELSVVITESNAALLEAVATARLTLERGALADAAVP
jgi:branched-chain amino acid transport system ATP-binding protein